MRSIIIVALLLTATATRAEPPRQWQMHRIGDYRGEACNVADFNNDGKLDIVALPYLYLAPDFEAVKIAEVQGEVDDQGKGYRWDFMNAPLDVDGDGLLDIVTCSWHGQRAEWLRNPGKAGGMWKRTLIDEYGNYECGDLADIDGDGKAHEILPHVSGTIWYEPGEGGMVKHVISDERMEFGAGCGDVNGDGRPDIIRPNAWFEAPEDPRKGEWKKHPLALGGQDGKAVHTPQILVDDINGDGLADLITGSAHGRGIHWYEQQREGGTYTWKQHTIESSLSQMHSLALADMDGDGEKDLVTGKRFMAHNGNDPGANEPVGVYYYAIKRGPEPSFIRPVVSLGEGIGSALMIPVADFDADGDMDIIVTGKWGGPVWFENLLIK